MGKVVIELDSTGDAVALFEVLNDAYDEIERSHNSAIKSINSADERGTSASSLDWYRSRAAQTDRWLQTLNKVLDK